MLFLQANIKRQKQSKDSVDAQDWKRIKKTRLHHRHLIFERGSSRDCAAKIQKIFIMGKIADSE
jgi:hypothetical protein